LLGRASGANRATVDARGFYADKEMTIKSGIFGLDGLVAGITIVITDGKPLERFAHL